MNDVHEITFQEALDRTSAMRRHVLLGNGFSMAASGKFSYYSLVEAAGEQDQAILKLFGEHSTSDFELILQELGVARARALEDLEMARATEIASQISAVQEHLLRAVYKVHPSHMDSLRDRYESCGDFLNHFIGRRPMMGIAFTTNYDLLLLWTVMKNVAVRSRRGRLRFEDGFKGEWWDSSAMGHERLSIVYLHGALHLFSREGRVRRLVYQNGPKPKTLRKQIWERLQDNDLPLFVSEGTSEDKLKHIRGNPYLSSAYKKFGYACKYKNTVLFTYGHSLAERDQHIADSIGKGKIGSVFLGVYGGITDDNREQINALARKWYEQRGGDAARYPVQVTAYDTADLGLWETRPAESRTF